MRCLSEENSQNGSPMLKTHKLISKRTSLPQSCEVDEQEKFEMKSSHIKEINSIKQLNLLYNYLTRKIYASQQQHQTINLELLNHYFYVQSELKVRRQLIERRRGGAQNVLKKKGQSRSAEKNINTCNDQVQTKNNQHFEQFNQLQFFLLDNSYRNQMLNPTYQQMFQLLENKFQSQLVSPSQLVCPVQQAVPVQNTQKAQSSGQNIQNAQAQPQKSQLQFDDTCYLFHEFSKLDKEYSQILNEQYHNSLQSETFNQSSNNSSNTKFYYQGLTD